MKVLQSIVSSSKTGVIILIFFLRIKEACILLNILVGSAMLLHEALSNNNDKAALAEILADVGVHKMSPELALKVIATRTDIIHV